MSRKGNWKKIHGIFRKDFKKKFSRHFTEVYPENFRASKFYKKAGFRSEGYEFFIKWLKNNKKINLLKINK